MAHLFGNKLLTTPCSRGLNELSKYVSKWVLIPREVIHMNFETCNWFRNLRRKNFEVGVKLQIWGHFGKISKFTQTISKSYIKIKMM